MTAKVQGSSVAAVQTQKTQQTAQAEKAAPKAELAAQQKNLDGFVPGRKDDFRHVPGPGPIDIGGLLGKEKPTLEWGDRFNAANLSSELSSKTNALRLAFGEKSETVTREKDGTYRGPEGQPLVQVELDDGNTAYVDPNTNEYYLTNEEPNLFGQVQTLPASPLPEGSQFSNSHFSDSDVKELTQIADTGSPFGHKLPQFPELPPKFPKLPDFEPIPLLNKGPIQG